MLHSRGTDTWTFSASGVEPAVEESIFFAGLSGPRKARQIVLAFKVSDLAEVSWEFRRDQAGRQRDSLKSRAACATGAASAPDQDRNRNGRRFEGHSRARSRSSSPRAAVGFRQDRAGRIRRRTSQGRGRADLDRRHGEGDRYGWHRGARRLHNYRLSRDHGRAREDAAPGDPRSAARHSRRCRPCARHARSCGSSRSTSWWSTSTRSRRSASPVATMGRWSRISTSAARRWCGRRPRTMPMSPSSPTRTTTRRLSTLWR